MDSLNVLEQRIGREKARLVMQKAGGRRLVVPADLQSKRETGKLEELLGRELAVLVVLHFGGSMIYIPHDGGRNRVKTKDVVRLTIAKKSASDIAAELNCSDRTVYSHRVKARELGLL